MLYSSPSPQGGKEIPKLLLQEFSPQPEGYNCEILTLYLTGNLTGCWRELKQLQQQGNRFITPSSTP